MSATHNQPQPQSQQQQHFAVVQQGYLVMGIGDSSDAAITDAIEWADLACGSTLAANLVNPASAAIGECYVAPCSAALAALVQTDGGDVAVSLVDGTLQLDSEWS